MDSKARRILDSHGSKWWAAGFYGPGGRKGGKGRPGEREGDLAIETVHASQSSRDIEVAALRSRPDIGRIDTWET